jgi:hypothetical protein
MISLLFTLFIFSNLNALEPIMTFDDMELYIFSAGEDLSQYDIKYFIGTKIDFVPWKLTPLEQIIEEHGCGCCDCYNDNETEIICCSMVEVDDSTD